MHMHNPYESRPAADNKDAEVTVYRAETDYLKAAPEYKHLSQEKNGAVQVAVNIRRELKKAFPGVKFSVTTRSCDCVNIKWTDGVTEERVKAITDKYRDSYFDSMQDLAVSCRSRFNEIYGGVGYVFTKREYSGRLKEKANVIFMQKYGHAFTGEEKTPEMLKRGELWKEGHYFHRNGFAVQTEINKILYQTE
ncbi:LPD29 domain-containing protein [Erwinia typographi]|uniref:LPD29 domain-containing protein n=1 Tax=Erwinia typographi TaxID=371042 RepID=UPI0006912454|nr:LPD29 domain-containing protein [Erwinia typographi]